MGTRAREGEEWRDGVVLEDGDHGYAVMGEEIEDLEAAERAGVLFRCPTNDGTCENGRHEGEGFFHFHPGKTWDDYDDVFFRTRAAPDSCASPPH